MNCKQGDLAVIVRSLAGNEGKIVRCLRLIPQTPWAIQPGPRWIVDRTLPGVTFDCDSVPDAFLRPLRDSDGEDEMLRMLGRPVGARQAA